MDGKNSPNSLYEFLEKNKCKQNKKNRPTQEFQIKIWEYMQVHMELMKQRCIYLKNYIARKYL